ncbi:Zinc finger domain-containing protein 1 [Takifugu flavidus]|uniref:Zinc finger domain-containing protein 1 n=1 Tax=Takifugu flavidus TaxID=433684 RepID=A0A5C6N0C1_9TELE|nr:Zinc finger domain-containing protein 1 [Takifugu flavidus]
MFFRIIIPGSSFVCFYVLQAPCCGKLYVCRLCHDAEEKHKMDRFKVREVQCCECQTVQQAQQNCEQCHIQFGEYYCDICHLFDKNKKQYHCQLCGICRNCFDDMVKMGAYRCPLCMHSVWDMADHWKQIDQEIAQSPMPPEYQGATVKIMCNDCQTHCTVPFHVLGMKCSSCRSYNTAQDGGLMQQQQQQQQQNTEDEAETEQHIQP